jgi:hypothetical protein
VRRIDMLTSLASATEPTKLFGGTGESMTDSESVADGYDQIGRARGELNAVSTSPFLRRKVLSPAITRADHQKVVNTAARPHAHVSSFSIEPFVVVVCRPCPTKMVR